MSRDRKGSSAGKRAVAALAATLAISFFGAARVQEAPPFDPERTIPAEALKEDLEVLWDILEEGHGGFERYTPAGPDHLWYEATIEDPQTFSRPWKIRMPLYRHINPDARLGQFKCVEFVEELMYGKYRKQSVQ